MNPQEVHDYLKQDKPLPRLLKYSLLWGPITLVWTLFIFHDEALVYALVVSLIYLSGYLYELRTKRPDNVLLKLYFTFWKYLFMGIVGFLEIFGALLGALITVAVIGGIIGILYFGWKQFL
jgi:hypothetical protein